MPATYKPEAHEQAGCSDMNRTATVDPASLEARKAQQREQWLEENRAAVISYNEHVEAQGVFSYGMRGF